MGETSNKIREFIKKRFLGDAQAKLRDSDSLFEKGIIDSLGLLEAVAFIEKTFGVSISPSEVVIENFNSVEKIVQLIEKKIRNL
jgi:acyl carrier protein